MTITNALPAPLQPDATARGEPGPWETFGPLTPYLMREGVTDLFLTGDGVLWSDGGSRGLHRVDGWRSDPQGARRLATRLIASGGRHLDEATPFADVRLGGGIRVHAVLSPISTSGAVISIRVPSAVVPGIDDLVRCGSATQADAARLRAAVAARTNLLVTGAGGAGKTTLLGSILALAPPDERIVLIEDVAELRVAHPHVVGLQTLVLGECRGEEVVDLLSALNTGHDGGAGTLHANSIADVPARLEALGALAGMSEIAVARQTTSAIGLIVHVERSAEGRRIRGFGRFTTTPHGRLAVVGGD